MPTLYAHRGASAERPENTLPSFQRALEVGADAIELDAHMTADGEVIVSHDPSGERMCGVAREFRRSLLAEVQSWDAGHGFVDDSGQRPFAGKQIRIPTLHQVLEELDVPINIDLKQAHPNMVSAALRVIRGHRAEGRVTVASFRWMTLLEVRARGYRGDTGLSRPETLALVAGDAAFRAMPLTGTAAQWPTRAGRLDLTKPSLVARCRRLGIRLDYWTINDVEEARSLLALGADGIMTDDPARLAPLFQVDHASRG